MGRIQSSVGLVTGLDIQGTVDQLMQIASRPRDLLKSRTEALQQQQVAIGELTALTIGVQLAAKNLGQDATYDARTATSSKSTVLAATVTGAPATASYQFTPTQLAQTHQLLADGVADAEADLTPGTFTYHFAGDAVARTVTIEAEDSLQDLIAKINALEDGGVAASLVNDGSGATPYRLSLVSKTSGAEGEIIVDTPPPDITLATAVAAQDAKLFLGDPDTGIELRSATNDFTEVVEGLKLTILETSETPITINITNSDSSFVTRVKLLVDQYNKLHDKLATHTAFDATTNTTGVLFGSSEALRVGNVVSDLMSGRIFGAGPIQSLAELGLNLDQNGKLSLDETKLKAKYAADPASVKQFFTTESTGVAARFHSAIEPLTGLNGSLLLNRNATLQRKIEFNNDRIDAYAAALTRQRDKLLLSFYNLESAIGKMKNDLNAISALQAQLNTTSTQ